VQKKVLIITREFLPYCHSLGGVMRVLKLGEYLVENGCEVFILAGKEKKKLNYFGYKDSLHKMHISYNPVKQKEDKYWRILYSFNKNIGRGFEEFAIPDAYVYSVNSYFKSAVKMIKKYKIKNVIISSPPHSMQLVGLKLKKYFGKSINLIVDYRDSWNTNEIFMKKNYLAQRISEFLEKKVLKNADHFTFISQPILKKVEKKYNIDISKKSTLIANGYDQSTLSDDYINKNNKISGDCILLGHFGTVSDSDPYRNISNFLRALNKLQNDSHYASKINLHLFGTTEFKKFRSGKIKEIINIHKPVSHLEALNKMKEMDWLLVFCSNYYGADEVVTGRLYEYISVRKPIIVIGPQSMEAVRIVEEENIGIFINIEDENDILNKLKDIIDGKIDEINGYDTIDLERYSRQYQYSKFFKIFK